MGGLLRGVARTAVVAGTATAVSNRVARRQEERWAGQEQEEYAAQQAAAPAPAPVAAPPVDDDIAQLQQLADLHQQGILTDDEFAAKKAQVLGI